MEYTKIVSSRNYAQLDDGEAVDYFPKMFKFNEKRHFHVNKRTVTLGESHTLDINLSGLHTAFRKGTDSPASGIVWTCINQLKDNHVDLLLDTMENTLPLTLDADNDDDKKVFDYIFRDMFEFFFRRLHGNVLNKEKNGFDGRVIESFTKYSELYRAILSNFESAIRIENSEEHGSYAGFVSFMYFEPEKEANEKRT